MERQITEERTRVSQAQDRILEAAAIDLTVRELALSDGPTLQVLEAGKGDPLVFWHGSGVNALSMLPLIERFTDRRIIAPHRPGYGLSEPISYTKSDLRQRSVRIIEQVLDAYEIDRADMVGNSTGGIWSLWSALDRPDRAGKIALVGATPLLPGTKPPLPLRLMATPGIATLLGRVMPEPSPKTVRQMMAGMGEGDTIGRHPLLIDVFVAAGSDPVAGAVSRDELSAMLRGLAGFRSGLRFTNDELARIEIPVLLAWGEHDPVGGEAAARQVANLLPNAVVEILEGGHAPWLGEPDRVAKTVRHFLQS